MRVPNLMKSLSIPSARPTHLVNPTRLRGTPHLECVRPTANRGSNPLNLVGFTRCWPCRISTFSGRFFPFYFLISQSSTSPSGNHHWHRHDAMMIMGEAGWCTRFCFWRVSEPKLRMMESASQFQTPIFVRKICRERWLVVAMMTLKISILDSHRLYQSYSNRSLSWTFTYTKLHVIGRLW